MKFSTFLQNIFSPVLSDREIKKLYNKGKLIKGNITDSQIQPNSVDLRLSDSYAKLRPNCERYISINNENDDGQYIDWAKPIDYESGVFNKFDDFQSSPQYLLMPGEFVLMATKEVISIPNGYIGFVCGRSSIARMAVQTEQAGLIDAGFEGTITLEMYNQSKWPIILTAGMRIAQVYFLKAKHSEKLYSRDRGSKYNGQAAATGSRIYMDKP